MLFLVSVASAASAYYVDGHQLNRLFLPVSSQDAVGVIDGNRLDARLQHLLLDLVVTPPGNTPHKPAAMPQQHFQVSLMQAHSVRAYELEQRLEDNWKEIASWIKAWNSNSPISEEEAENGAASIEASPLAEYASVYPGDISNDQAVYELMVDAHVQHIGDTLYQQRYGRQGLSGAALVRMSVHADGNVLDLELLQSSGNPAVDDLVIESVYQAAPFTAFPAGMRSPFIIERWLSVTPDSHASFQGR